MKRFLMFAMALLLSAATAGAAVVSAPNVSCAPGTPLALPITATGGDMFNSMVLNIAIGGGTITALDMYDGLVAQVIPPYGIDQPCIYTDNFGRSAVNADHSFFDPRPATGTLAVLHIDTTGLAEGTYEIALAETDGGDTALGGPGGTLVPTTLVNGSFTITPEPSALALLALGGLLIRRRMN